MILNSNSTVDGGLLVIHIQAFFTKRYHFAVEKAGKVELKFSAPLRRFRMAWPCAGSRHHLRARVCVPGSESTTRWPSHIGRCGHVQATLAALARRRDMSGLLLAAEDQIDVWFGQYLFWADGRALPEDQRCSPAVPAELAFSHIMSAQIWTLNVNT